jgi:uncharacterized protein
MSSSVRNRARLARRVWIPAVAVIVLLLVVLGGIGWYGAEQALNPGRANPEWSLSDYPALQPEDVSFESGTGVTLEGRFFPGEHGGTIVTHHGFTGWQDQILPQVQIFHDAGFNVLTFDSRHPRYGPGIFSTMGILEREDLVAAVDYLLTRDDVDPERIGAWGISLGGASVLLAAEQDPRIAAVISEVPFSDGENVVKSSFERYIGLPAFPFANVTRAIAEWRAGANMDDHRPVDAIASITDRPILLIHGLDDTAVPPDHSERLVAAGGDNVDVWWIPGADHSDAHIVGGDEYAERLIDFFDRALGN